MRSLLSSRELSKHPVDIGDRTEGAIIGRLRSLGYRLLMPCGPNQRYDLVLDLDGEFCRAQCKTGRLKNGVIAFSTRSVQSNSKGVAFRIYSPEEVDMFLVFCPETGGIYAVPIAEVTTGVEMSLRVSPTLNRQAKGVRWAKDYELPT